RRSGLDARERGGANASASGSGAPGGIGTVVLGYGVNVGPMAFEPALGDRATSLEVELGRPIDRPSLLIETLVALGRRYGDPLVASWRLLTLRERTADEVGVMVAGLFAHQQLDLGGIKAAVMSSVVPVLTPIMRGMVTRYFEREVFVVDPVTNSGMPILYERPAEVGAD